MVEFTVNGMTMSTILTKKFRNRHRWAKPDDKQISSFIPGTIREVFVKEGDHVQQNDRLLILEAMKMMNVIASPVSCTVARIHVRSGDKVPKGKVMIEIEPD
ncbi:MAG: acetyl-CoA carboxylase biotin carboxyl carrier protein subunit [Bacteroidales bacterium]|nr:acetyl-CoA carboxylase biotin carboxyl carrier protein subunit [Bacteroidales bacterium]